jgi:uncharacterized membrane protein YeaQ/YmgE (transglycosylase-associated protein family)
MVALPIPLADVVVFNGHALGFHFNITLTQLIDLGIAVLVGLLAEFATGWRLRFGLIGAIIAALIGIWLLTDIIIINLPWELYSYGVPIFKTLLGAILAVIIWHWLTYRARSTRTRTERKATRHRSRRQSQRYS